jgi:predicted chitinase
MHVQNGRSKTMNSQHLKRLALDLNFFREDPDGNLRLTYDVDELRPLGDYWESLDGANRWGGNWSSFKDTPHFERREGTARTPTTAAVAGAPAPVAAPPRRTGRSGAGCIRAPVGEHRANDRDDVETVQRMLNLCASRGRVTLDTPLKPDGAFGTKTLGAINAFQRQGAGFSDPDGVVDPAGKTIGFLADCLPERLDADLLALVFLRADDGVIDELAPGILQAMAKRAIDTPLRQAHFLAQIGHESMELRFREEIASGQAYEGRTDLGNTRPGDGPRFKGRGLIQLTGRANYTEYGENIGRRDEILANPEIVATDPELCVDVAGWYWETRKINALADRDDLVAVTKRINGGTRGLEDRRRLLLRAKAMLDVV